ncbi:hypothetical protein BDZ91DRAFT_431924 [Kalaharituber pfeilii]|nr:hypothetical protein BDZ91DRAFT_431924 [Kalaharituber pfeilii]
MHTPLQQMVQVAGTSRTIREVLAPLTWLVEDAEREYEPDVTPSPFDMLTQVPSFMQAAITEMALQLGITFGTIPLLGFVLAKILLSAPEVGLHFLDHVAGNSIHPAVIRRARRPLQTVFKWAAWLTGQSRTVKFLVWAYVQWHLFKGSLWPVTDLLQKSVEIVYRHLRVNRSVTARAAEKVNRRDRPARYCSILKLACEIARRHASNDLDRIAGLNYLIKCNTLPTYSETEDCEVAWLRCVAHLPYAAQLELLFNFPDARVHDTENHQGPDLHWIPAWSQVTRLRLQPGLELQRPAWPPSWLERSPDTDYVTAYNGAKKTYDPTTHALLLSCSARVFVARSISCRTSTNQYAVTVAVDVTNQGTSIPCIIAHFFCPHGGSLQGIDERAAYLLITHARDDEGGPISWVVADVLHPPFAKEALLKVAEGKESGFAKIFFLLLIWRLVPGFISSEVFKSDPAVRPDWGQSLPTSSE